MNDHHWWRWWLHRILYAILHNFHFSWGYKNNPVVPKIRHTNVEQVSKQWDIQWFHTCKSRNAVFNSGPSLRSPTGPPNQTILSRHCFILLNTLVPDIANDCMCCSYWAEWDITSWENVFKIQNYGFPYCRWLIWTMFWNIKHQNTIYPNRPIHPKCISSSAVSVIKQPNPKTYRRCLLKRSIQLRHLLLLSLSAFLCQSITLPPVSSSSSAILSVSLQEAFGHRECVKADRCTMDRIPRLLQ